MGNAIYQTGNAIFLEEFLHTEKKDSRKMAAKRTAMRKF
jgi:hypothetical protein